ncbi:MAG: hypothetical protein JXA78_08475, partial [Anaerolineales bacterium]|nr:hypothetical protein [Anaerolineales bacterium]
LQDVLSLAEPEGYVRVFLDAGEPMAGLLAAFIQQRAAPQALRIYASKLLAALEAEHLTQGSAPGGGGAASAVIGPDWIEPLSEREMEVLGLVAAGLSNREIGGQLVLEVSTVKSHINHIFRKLGVSKRTQAVARARELGLHK